MTTIREAPKRILELGRSFCELNFPFGQVARVRPAILNKPARPPAGVTAVLAKTEMYL